MRLGNIADVLRAAGLTVIEVPGWRGRGKDLARVDAIVWHHTATGRNWTDQRVADLLRNGRPDVPGPLSQLGLDRQGRYWVIADGRANHNGYGTHGNNTIGIEAYNSGTGEPWPDAQVDAYVRGAAALGHAYGVPVHRQLGHRETDPRRKIDPAGLNMDDMRRRVAATDHRTGELTMDAEAKAAFASIARRLDRQDNEIEKAILEGRKHHEIETKVLRQIRAWVRVVAEVAGGLAGRSPADLAKRADQLNK